MIIDQPEFNMPADGEHVATFASYEDLGELPDPWNDGKMKRRIKVVWELEDGAEQWDWMTASLHTQATLYEVASILLGHSPAKRQNLDELLGKSCRIIIKHYEGQDGKTKSKVENYLPVAAGTRPRQAMPAGPITDADIPF